MNNYRFQCLDADCFYWVSGFLLHHYPESAPRKGNGAFVVFFSLTTSKWDDENWEDWQESIGTLIEKGKIDRMKSFYVDRAI